MTLTYSVRALRRLLTGAFCALAIALPAASADLRKVTVDEGVELAVRQSGNGPLPVFFLHGYSLSMDTWEKVIDKFPADRYTRYAYDLRGFGDSSKPERGYNMRQHAKDLGVLMDRLQVQRAILIGHSLGGAISQEFAIENPARTLAVVTSDAFARHLPLPGANEAIRKRADSFGALDTNREILKGAVPRYFDPRNGNAADVERFLNIALKSSSAALRDQLIDAYDAPTLSAERYRQLRVPVLAVSGAVDHVVPVAQAIAVSDIVPDAEIALVARAGHTPMWERPEAWTTPVLEFLSRRVSPRP
ncbi:MAG: alpha/beta hydrolase [Ottowia sp.]|uniref:alpha/beta fold hydrolase n=1 Tax=Ottowia sp. TaxID=1898956 RepID=UPI003C72A55B